MGLKPINTMIFERIWIHLGVRKWGNPSHGNFNKRSRSEGFRGTLFSDKATWWSNLGLTFSGRKREKSPDSHCFGHWRIPWFWSLENTMILIIGEYHDSDHLTWSQWELMFWSNLYYQEPPTKNGQFGGPSKSLVLIPHDLWLVGGVGYGWTGWSIKHAGIEPCRGKRIHSNTLIHTMCVYIYCIYQFID
jgi:hypothetical protein